MKNLTKNWKTTIAAAFAIGSIVIATWLPEYRDELEKATAVLISLGLLAAKDGDKTGV
jgi:hypothetical protein